MTGMVFQHFALFPHRTIIDNVGYGLKVQGTNKGARDDAALKALALVGLEAYAHYSPSQLSGGMQQRAGLARALAADPPILLMDEAFALDPLIRRQMQDEMMDIQAELHKTILFITHDLNEALRIGDRACIMKDGEVVQIGTPEEILTEPATGYVAEFVQDVDQAAPSRSTRSWSTPAHAANASLGEALTALGDRAGCSCSTPTASPSRCSRPVTASAPGFGWPLHDAVRSDFHSCTPEMTLNEVYAAAGKGLPIAVCDADGKLVGNLDPRHIMEEMGWVESLIDNFEREVFM